VADESRGRIALGRRAVLEPRDAIAQRGHPETQHRRSHRDVRHPVESPFLEAAVEMDVPWIRHDRVAHHSGKAPARARNDGGRSVRLVAHRHQRISRVEVCCRIRVVASIGEQHVSDVGRRLELRVHASPQGLPVRIERVGSEQSEEPGDIGQIDLPSAGGHRVAAPHEEPVAHVDGRVGI
jgi:hypothetical protein